MNFRHNFFSLQKSLFMISILALISCNTDIKNNKDNIIEVQTNWSKSGSENILKLLYPDTVLIKKLVEGELIYNMNSIELDSSKIADRTIFLHVDMNTSEDPISFKEMNKYPHIVYEDSLLTGKFSFGSGYRKKGQNYLHIVIQDLVLMKGLAQKDSLLVNKFETIITKPVYVKDTIED